MEKISNEEWDLMVVYLLDECDFSSLGSRHDLVENISGHYELMKAFVRSPKTQLLNIGQLLSLIDLAEELMPNNGWRDDFIGVLVKIVIEKIDGLNLSEEHMRFLKKIQACFYDGNSTKNTLSIMATLKLLEHIRSKK